MKIKFVCALLLSTAANEMSLATMDDADPSDEALGSLISSAMAGAKPGVIKEPTQKNTDKEGDK